MNPADQTDIRSAVDALKGFASFADLASALIFKPITETQIEGLSELDWASIGSINDDFKSGANDISRYLAKRNSGTRQDLAVDYTASMGGMSTWQGKYAVPCASVFTSDEGLMYQDSYHKAYELYRAHGLTRAEGFDYPDDHLALMLEFLSIMANRTADLISSGETESAAESLNVCTSFIDNAILPWYEDFAEIALKLISTRFYRGVLSITRGLLAYGHLLFQETLSVIHQTPNH